MHYFRSNYIHKNHIIKLKCYTFNVEKNIGILGYESLGYIKLVVLEQPSLKNYLLNRVLCYQRFWMELTEWNCNPSPFLVLIINFSQNCPKTL